MFNVTVETLKTKQCHVLRCEIVVIVKSYDPILECILSFGVANVLSARVALFSPFDHYNVFNRSYGKCILNFSKLDFSILKVHLCNTMKEAHTFQKITK